MPLYLLQVEEVVRYFGDFGLKRRLLRVWLLGLEVNGVHGLAKLEEGLIFDPARVVRQAALQEIKTSYQFIGLCLLNFLEELRKKFYADATDAPNAV